MKAINQQTTSFVFSGISWDGAGHYDSSEHSWPQKDSWLNDYNPNFHITQAYACMLSLTELSSESGYPWLQSTNYLKSIFIWAPSKQIKYH